MGGDGRERRDSLIARIGTSKFYLVEPPESQTVLANLRKNRNNWINEIAEKGQPFLELPLKPGKGFSTEQTEQEKKMNSGPHAPGFDSWLVKKRESVSLQNVKSNVPLWSHTQYTLVYELNKSEVWVGFVPTIGITAYHDQGYAGVPPESKEWGAQCELIEYHR